MTVKIQVCEKSEPDKIFKGLYNKSHKKPSMFTYSIHIYLWLKFIITLAPENAPDSNVPRAGNKIA